jgi:hypothetical protein
LEISAHLRPYYFAAGGQLPGNSFFRNKSRENPEKSITFLAGNI